MNKTLQVLIIFFSFSIITYRRHTNVTYYFFFSVSVRENYVLWFCFREIILKLSIESKCVIHFFYSPYKLFPTFVFNCLLLFIYIFKPIQN